jgi:hypothetical protein
MQETAACCRRTSGRIEGFQGRLWTLENFRKRKEWVSTLHSAFLVLHQVAVYLKRSRHFEAFECELPITGSLESKGTSVSRQCPAVNILLGGIENVQGLRTGVLKSGYFSACKYRYDEVVRFAFPMTSA